MNKMYLLVTLALLSALPLLGQRVRLSPHETLSLKIDSNRVTVTYGRPYTKDPKTNVMRKIWGGLVPYDKVWRTGADEATLFITQQPIDLGGATIPAGAYTLFTFPSADGSAKLIVNKQIGQWGVDPYDAKQELTRIPMVKETLEKPVDQFTMMLEKNPAGGAWLRMAWENTRYSVPYTVKK